VRKEGLVETMIDDETLSESELSLPASVANMTHNSVYSILSKPAHRGYTIAFFATGLGVLGLILSVIYHSYPWGITSTMWYMLFGVSSKLAAQKVLLTRVLAAEPQTVFWAQPRRSRLSHHLFGYDHFLVLHAKTGKSIEVAIRGDDMRNVIAWFKQQSPGIRIGRFEA